MTPMVVDASVTMARCFEDEASPGTEAVLDRLLHDAVAVQAVWCCEAANVLPVAGCRHRITEATAQRFLGLLFQLPIHVGSSPPDVAALGAVGRRHRLSACDAAYLLLAEWLAALLATLDDVLERACRNARAVRMNTSWNRSGRKSLE